MPSKKQMSETRVLDSQREPEKPLTEREPGENAKPGNDVAAKDPFGGPKADEGWTREAIAMKTRKPSFDGADDPVTDELADKHKK
ncbi:MULTISPECIES: hypothetical protein [unclassified Roseovarius]|uniref:hypothetical protein n=1 Tax=unclassified Roseovarius TaxID=2614913 RepID=UPI00273F4C99|nr:MULTISPECIES: hypothetical protein [unclassified Roseovarius]